ncbi:CrcB family protein [Nocardioides sp.]|uniref:fluoride efflux transporter FluC n=1 Tax=Nocardioides sp. TaxID=35761 RepID=UPI0027375138|nr:CrcB family protein [Nocardioides sp.]MDP3891993.1 CrcB family protein [Nocardioides sp.]
MTAAAPALRALAAVAAGGALGAVGRWLIDGLAPLGSGFPWTTFAINVVGSFLLAALPALAVVRRSPGLVLFLGPGVLGGFTTLSAYAEDARRLVDSGQVTLAAAYVVGTLVACLLAVTAAHRLSAPAEQREFDREEGNE